MNGVRQAPFALVAAIALVSGSAQGAVYRGESGNELFLGNDLVEIRFSRGDGSLLGLRAKGGRDWVSQAAAIPFALSIDQAATSVWTAREGSWYMPARQPLASREFEETPSRVSLVLQWLEPKVTRVAVTLRVEIEDGSPWIRFRFRVENQRDSGVVTVFSGPIISRLSPPASPTLVWPALRGEIHRGFSGFLAVTYPRPASMQWFWVGDAAEGLYYGVHDATLRYKELRFGTDTDLSAGIAASVRTWCFVPPSGIFDAPEVVVGPHQGDWHVGGDRYRHFVFEAGWARKPADWVRDLRGWSNLWIKDQNQVLQNGYAKIPERLLAIHANKIDLLDVFGWHWNGFDTFYPDYVPLADAGGDAGLRSAIAAAHSSGDRVMLYFNSRVAHPESAWHLANPTAANVLQAGGGPLKELYNSIWFFVECPASPVWRKKLSTSVAEAVTRGADGVWYDQLAGAPPALCYAQGHGHRDPALAFAGLQAIAQDARRAIGADRILTCEGELDALGAEVDIFGTLWFHPFGYKPEDAPEVLRYTLPGKLVGLKAQGANWGTPAYHSIAFLLGSPLLDDNPGSLRFLSIYDSAPECFYRGRFLDTVGLSISPRELVAKLHVSEDRASLAVAVWNAGGPVLGSVAVNLAALGSAVAGNAPLEVLELPVRKSVPFDWDGKLVRYSATYPGASGSAHRIVLSTKTPFRRGDANCDGALDISDPLATLDFLFTGKARIPCERAADGTADGTLDISDAVYLLGFLFLGTAAPRPPFPGCGEDLAPGPLTCAAPCGCPAPRG